VAVEEPQRFAEKTGVAPGLMPRRLIDCYVVSFDLENMYRGTNEDSFRIRIHVIK
jgi:hypothetical protein